MHNIAKINGRVSMAYTGQTPWHKLGIRMPNTDSVEAAIQAANLDWTVEGVPVYLKDGTQVPDTQAIVRPSDSAILGTVGGRYIPIQNREAFEPLQVALTEFGATIESAGALGKGEKVWLLCKLPDTNGHVLPGDKIQPYLTNATKIKRTLLRSECLAPPREIRENTKARRAWLAERLAEVTARTDREAKIVGTGSYQSLSVYEIKSVAGRLRLRGTCQFCGNSQVVDHKLLVLHGYKRPGDGMVYGRCPGVGLKSLNHDKAATENWLTEAIAAHETAKDTLATAEMVKQSTSDALYDDSIDTDLRSQASAACPHRPDSWRNPTAEAIAKYREDYKAWANTYPLSAAHNEASRSHEAARQYEWQARANRDHFQRLIDSKVYGIELTREIV